ncbi:MAG TPA: RodZ domain-containing protein [Anaerolineales bacterium]|nr:RodZ domain-containing protein [Anaerolineales bacterium]
MQTIGQRLKATREEKQLTLAQVFEATRIRIPYLRALELDDLSSMPSPVQARGYLRNYAEYLGLDIDQILEDVKSSPQMADRIIGPADSTDQLDDPTPELSPDSLAAPLPSPTVDSEQEAGSQLETVTEEAAEIETENVIDSDVTESLWQTWLNRVASRFPKQKKQTTQEHIEPEDVVGEEVELTDEWRAELEEQQEISSHESDEPSDDLPASTNIFKEIGVELRNSREALNLHLDEVERNIRVKAHYLEALEQGAMDKLPSTVQTRGMLSNYAAFLDMDVDAILLRFADAVQARHRENNPQIGARKSSGPIIANLPPLRSFVAGDMIFGIGMAVLLVGFVIWGINRVVTLQSQREIRPTAPSISDVLLASPDPSLFTPTATLLPVESFAGEATPTIIIPTVNVNVSVQVNLVAVERTYMRVIVDGENVFEGRVVPGNVYFYEAEEQVEILVGSGAAIRIAYNGRDLGLLGAFGEIISNIYRAEDIVTPTALPTAEATNTVPPTATSRPTNTPVPSATP